MSTLRIKRGQVARGLGRYGATLSATLSALGTEETYYRPIIGANLRPYTILSLWFLSLLFLSWRCTSFLKVPSLVNFIGNIRGR